MAAMDDHAQRRDDREGGPASTQDRIVDRRIERRALPASFSSNLGRKGLSPGRKVSDRSVKAMVFMFEQTTSIPEDREPDKPQLSFGISSKARESDWKQVHEGGTDSKKLENRAIVRPQLPYLQQRQPVRSIAPTMYPSAHVGYEVEEYSLTLLKHKSYFNNRPLARCLDNLEEKGSDENRVGITQQVNSKKEGSTEPKLQKIDSKKKEKTWNSTPSPIERLDNLMTELLVFQEECEAINAEAVQEEEKRDPEDVKRFWDNVRAQLWIDDEEIYGEGAESKTQVQPNNNSETTQTDTKEMADEGNEVNTLEPMIPNSAILDTTTASAPEPKRLPPPMPTRTPPPVPVPQARPISTSVTRTEGHMAASSQEVFPETDLEYPMQLRPAPTSRPRLSTSTPSNPDITDLIAGTYPEQELPPAQTWSGRGDGEQAAEGAAEEEADDGGEDE
ncbi:hypothetical protein N0V88_000984 [Collariella sp. IMI 366227]|nr:hypothetical protein N0V88_000984 [Collariella sp. IMI 366227]